MGVVAESVRSQTRRSEGKAMERKNETPMGKKSVKEKNERREAREKEEKQGKLKRAKGRERRGRSIEMSTVEIEKC